jgi:hypothetical protein
LLNCFILPKLEFEESADVKTIKKSHKELNSIICLTKTNQNSPAKVQKSKRIPPSQPPKNLLGCNKRNTRSSCRNTKKTKAENDCLDEDLNDLEQKENESIKTEAHDEQKEKLILKLNLKNLNSNTGSSHENDNAVKRALSHESSLNRRKLIKKELSELNVEINTESELMTQPQIESSDDSVTLAAKVIMELKNQN